MARESETRMLDLASGDSAPRKRRDLFGVGAVPLALVHLVVFFALRGVAVNNGGLVVLMLVASACGAVAFAFAVTGIVLRRGRSLAGWATVLLYAVVVLLFHR